MHSIWASAASRICLSRRPTECANGQRIVAFPPTTTELNGTVIARKVSFGSQSEAGAKTREVLMSVMQTLKKRVNDPIREFKRALDELALNANLDPVNTLFPSESG